MGTSFQHVCVAIAGLDLLHVTRLKVACSLLMAERVVADVQAWPSRSAGVLVASLDDTAGAIALDEGRASGIPVVVLGRGQVGGQGQLRHGATVREMFEQLRGVFLDTPVERVEPILSETLFDAVQGAGVEFALLERSGVRAVLERDAGLLHVAGGDMLELLEETCVDTGWRAQAIPRSDFEDVRSLFPHALPLETFAWRIAHAADMPLGRAPTTPLMLKSWPAIEAGALPAHWLLPLACLMQRGWTAPALAQTSGLSAEETRRLFAAIHHSGLAGRAEVPLSIASPRPARVDPADTGGFLLRVARRFGMHFGGKRD